MVATQANERATAEGKTAITEAHAIAALTDLGFGHYCEAAGGDAPKQSATSAAPAEWKRVDRKVGKKAKRKQPPDGMSEEDLLRMQQELFASARANMASSKES